MLEFYGTAVAAHIGEPDGELERVTFTCEQECLLDGKPVEAGLVFPGDLFGINLVACPGRSCESCAKEDVPNKFFHYL